MAVVEILEDLYFIERGYLNANHFAFKSSRPVLIDTGYRADFDRTEKLLASLGIGLDDVESIVTTHCHCDHIGGNKIIQDRSGCDVALHPLGKYFMDTRDDWSTWWRYYGQEADFFHGGPALQDDARIAVGPHVFRVIHTPGHAADGLVLYHEKEKILIASDTLWEFDLPVMTVRIEGSAAVHNAWASLQKVADLDVAIVYPGHGKPFTDFQGALERNRTKLRAYLEDRTKIGEDLIRKIMVYTLLMRRIVAEDRFFSLLMETRWYRETVDLYFGSAYEKKYGEVVSRFLERGVLRSENGCLSTTVKP